MRRLSSVSGDVCLVLLDVDAVNGSCRLLVMARKEVCENCKRPLAVPEGSCGCDAGECGAAKSQCFDCLLECTRQTIAVLRADIARYQDKFGILRPGLASSARSSKG